jgi:hypothetical protein
MATTNTCKKCGCQDSFLTSPAPCPTPTGCPTPEPCSEVFNSECVIYTGDVLESGITVQDAIDELATKAGGVTIPNLKVGTLQGEVHVSLDFYDNAAWLDYNPKIFLFRTKKVQKVKGGNPNFKGRPSQFVHTTHMAGGDGSKWFKGSLGYDGGNSILRHTEFNVAETIPYKRFNLADQGMSPYEWITYMDQVVCDQISIFYETNFGSSSASLTTLGIINGRNYYQFTVDGKIFQIYYDALYTSSWVVQYTGDAPNHYSCTGGSDNCPQNEKNWHMTNDTTSGITFYSFIVNNNVTTRKRQALLSDISQYNNYSSIGDYSDTWNNEQYCFYINTPKVAYGDKSFAKEKIHFKLAIVIDNPNATPDKPFLIGPMSDAFVVRFMRGAINGQYAKFTNDYISKIMT